MNLFYFVYRYSIKSCSLFQLQVFPTDLRSKDIRTKGVACCLAKVNSQPIQGSVLPVDHRTCIPFEMQTSSLFGYVNS